MPFISKIQRQTDYSHFPSSHPIVIDNGGSYFRIGWAGEANPRVIFRNIVQRPRHKTTGETVTIVGDHDPALLKYFDCTRSGPRSAFDSNVVYQFEMMEYILDFGFNRLGADGSQFKLEFYNIMDKYKMEQFTASTPVLHDYTLTLLRSMQIDHPVLITECACNPVQSRSKMAELLFESYGVPSVVTSIINNVGFVIKMALQSAQDLAQVMLSQYDFPSRISAEGFTYGSDGAQNSSRLTWEKVEDLKMEHCYIAPDYASEVRLFQKGAKEAKKKTRCWQLPWTPSPALEPPSEEEIARKAALKEKQGQRLREMAEAKRSSKINELENESKNLEFLLLQLRHVPENEVPSFLSKTGYVSKQEIESAFTKTTQSLRKYKGELENEEKADLSAAEKYTLINIPDNMLTPEQVKEKKRQLFLKTTSEGRQRAKQKRFEEDLERERQNKQDEEKRLENPELYLGQLRAKHKELSEKVEQRKRLKTNGGHSNGYNVSGGVGRGERLNAAQRERMRLLTTAAFDRGKGEDTFGYKDEDWQLYKLMSKDNEDDDEGPDEDEAELARISSRLRDIDPTFVFRSEAGPSETSHLRPLTKEDFQIVLSVERFRCPEIIFNPNLIGIDQAGLDEMAGVSIRRLPAVCQSLDERMTNSILMMGGNCLFPGMAERLEAGIRMIRPCGTLIRVMGASDPILDAWRGAAAYAAAMQFPQQTFSKVDYYEKGEDWLRQYQLRYTY
ncbi:hypothetical protein RJ639_005102 [Escallonia herrerae]|uniref:Actin-related protein 5 n=1 Tax=Escallonia herrerae TaxID=1293975 RepID=A0AA88W1E5_9ASTE|nr:hypothetical protein RJ639_005102 [Escallonia herrerae]